MFAIERGAKGEIVMRGRLDASQGDVAARAFEAVSGAAVVDMAQLAYISSMGLGILMQTQKRLRDDGGEGLKLINVSRHIDDLLRISGFHAVFDIGEERG